MLKVFLVEDEFVVREGIKNKVDWASHGYEFVGEAGDGELAFPMIQKLKPDIVITDIKMPFMDGLELSKLIRKEFPWMEIVILSGYAEFDYAKEAINIGVAHYLTKPISGDDLLSEIDKIAERIEEKKKEREFKEKYLREMEENTAEEGKKLFQYMVTGNMPVSEILELAGKLGLDITAIYYNIVLLKIISLKHDEEEYSGSVFDAYEKMIEEANAAGALVFDRNMEGKALVFKADSIEDLTRIQSECIEKMKVIGDKYESIRYFGGIGKPVGRLRELGDSFDVASHAFAHRFFVDDCAFFSIGDAPVKAVSDNSEFKLSDIDVKGLDRKRVIEFIKTGDKDEIGYFLSEIAENLGPKAIESNLFRQYATMDVYFAVASVIDELGYSRDEIEQFNINSSDTQDVESMLNYLNRIIAKAIELRDAKANSKYNDVVDRIIEYINEHFADEELSLNYLAQEFNFSPNHLSMMFSQQTGMTFIKYLTDYRMNRAKELLRCTNKRSVDISVEVGYKDPHYFSYCFKKYQGVTPTQYRGKSVGDGDEV